MSEPKAATPFEKRARKAIITGLAVSHCIYEMVPFNMCPDDDPADVPRPLELRPVVNMSGFTRYLAAFLAEEASRSDVDVNQAETLGDAAVGIAVDRLRKAVSEHNLPKEVHEALTALESLI